MRARRTAALLLATGVTCLAGAAFPLLSPATAADEPGSGLGSYSLSANAPVVQIREDYAVSNCSASAAGTGACEGVVNESVSSLRNGPIGHALASVGWPGTLGGNAGSLIIVAQPGAPDQVSMLNDPVRAENFTNGPKDTVTNSTVPGALMTATATATNVAATSEIGQAQSTPLGTFSQIRSSSSTKLTGAAKAVATAHSEVHDVTIGGVLHLGAVVSDATATTNGVTAVPSGHTTVTGATVNGVPVTIDEHGITVQTQNVPFPGQVTDAVNTALANAGMTVLVSAPTGKPSGADVVYDAGRLVLVWKQQGAGTLTMMIGGAQVAVSSSPGYDDGGSTDGGTTGGTTGALAGGTTGAPLTGSVTPGTLPGSDPIPPAVTGPGPSVAPENRAYSGALPHGLSPWLGALAVVGAFLTMAGLRRLPDRVLVANPTSCPNGET
jgi:hypothetical protein